MIRAGRPDQHPAAGSMERRDDDAWSDDMGVSTAIHRRVAACRAGTDSTCVARVPAGWVVMGDPQVLRGYSLLLPDPAVFLADMARLGQALLQLTGAVRVNYAMFGNVEPALHAHVFPRFGDEPAGLREANPWGYDWAAAPPFDPARDAVLLEALRRRLTRAHP
jgi:hypothetical protein